MSCRDDETSPFASRSPLLRSHVLSATPLFAVNKDMVQLQTQVQQLQDAVARLQQSNDERMGVLKDLVQQTADSVNKMSATVSDLQKQMQTAQEAQGGKIDQVSGQIQSLNDSLDEVKARLNALDKTLKDIQSQQQSISATLQNMQRRLPQPPQMPPVALAAPIASAAPGSIGPMSPMGPVGPPARMPAAAAAPPIERSINRPWATTWERSMFLRPASSMS